MSNIKPSPLQQERRKLALTLHAQAKDRVLIAEAIWPDKKIYQIGEGQDDGGFVGYSLANGTFRNFNPYTDANDDNAILKWMLGQMDVRDVSEWLEHKIGAMYQVGDVASAALAYLQQSMEDAE